MIEHVHPDGRPVPTVRELYEMKDGYAEAVTFNKDMAPTSYRLTDKGYRLLGEIMRANAADTLARGTAKEEAVAAQSRVAAAPKEGKKGGGKSAWTPA